MLVVVIVPAVSRKGRRLSGVFDGFYRGKWIVRSAQPLLDGARALLRLGHDPAAMVGIAYVSAPYKVTLSASIAVAAGLTVQNDRLVRHQKAPAGPLFALPVQSNARPAQSPTTAPKTRPSAEVLS